MIVQNPDEVVDKSSQSAATLGKKIASGIALIFIIAIGLVMGAFAATFVGIMTGWLPLC